MQSLLFSLPQILCLLLVLVAAPLPAADIPAAEGAQSDTIKTLNSLLQLQAELKADIDGLNRDLDAAQGAAAKRDILVKFD
jgi:hypothetical protein